MLVTQCILDSAAILLSDKEYTEVRGTQIFVVFLLSAFFIIILFVGRASIINYNAYCIPEVETKHHALCLYL